VGDERARVVIIDDSATAVDLVSAALESAGFEVHGFTSIFEAPMRVDELKPALIIVDLLMPALGGDKVIDVLRRHSQHRCPIVLHSSAEENELKQRAKACGADGYVRKSRDFAALVRTVKQHVSVPLHSPL
jgi:CheY-like chemotaxis protein